MRRPPLGPWSMALPLLACATALSSQSAQEYRSVLTSLQNAAARPDSVAQVRGFVLRRDAMEFHLDSGRLYLLTPVAERTVGAVFIGRGSATFAPPLPIERGQLQHLMGDSILTAPLVSIVFFFTDSTLADLRPRLTFAPAAVAPGAQQPISDALDRLVDGHAHSTESAFMTALLNGDVNGFFFASIKRAAGEDVMFEIDPDADEPVVLLRRGRLPRQRAQIVSQFPRMAQLGDSLGPPRPPAPPLGVTEYDIESWIDNSLGFHAQATLHFTSRRAVTRWAHLLLFEDLQVDSVLEQGGVRDSFYRAGGNAELWVRLTSPLEAGQTRTVRVAYHGHLIELGSFMPDFLPPWARQESNRMWGLDKWYYVKDTETWYPRSDWRDAAVDLTFHTPSRLQFASIGRLVSTHVDGSVQTTHWVAERPTSQVSFNIGEFQQFDIADQRIPPVTVQVNEEAHRRLQTVLVRQLRDPAAVVGADVANSLAFFTQVFGPPLFSRYYATEIPYGHGQAFPGLIHLSWFTFGSMDQSGYNEIFRAHEMAHQWWGIGVEPASDRDRWLSEGFAEFAGLWYMQLILRDNTKYFHQLTTWADEIRGLHDHAEPIGIGSRIAQLEPDSYIPTIYSKGAWVLQMLRNLMLDLRDKNENGFTDMMQDFYQQYRGKTASTKDFQRMVETHLGIPMGWFFDEWVNGTAFPTYVLSWRTDSTAQDPHVLHLRVRQEDVPPNFIMAVPVLIKFGDNSEVYLRLNVHGPVTETAIAVPSQPTSVQLNPLQSVLCVVKQEDWH